jgi:hypothetical protein
LSWRWIRQRDILWLFWMSWEEALPRLMGNTAHSFFLLSLWGFLSLFYW